MAAAAALALYVKLPRGMLGDTQTMGDRIRVLGNPGVGAALITTFLIMCGTIPLLIYVGAIMAEVGIGHEAMPVVLLANGIGAVIASVSGGRIADWLGNRRAVSVALLVLIVGNAAFALLPVLPPEPRLALLLGLFALQGYVVSVYWIAHCSEMAQLAPSSVPVAISLDMAALSFGMAIAAAAGGIIVDNWGTSTLPYAAAPGVMLALFVWLAFPGRKAG
jgi:predicted MFS family arabinose efflux permease